MRIAYVVGAYPSLSETFIAREAEALCSGGHTVDVFPLWKGSGAPGDGHSAVSIRRCSRWPVFRRAPHRGRVFDWQCHFASSLLRAPRAALRALWYMSLADQVATRATSLGADRVHAQFGSLPSTVGWVVASLAGLPFSFAVHARDVFVEAEFFAAKARAADRIIACNSAAARRAAELAGERDRAKIVLVPHGLPLGRYPFRGELPGGEPLILGVGRFVEKKGFAYLVEAVALLRRRGSCVRCWLIGDGPGRKALERQIAQLAVGDAVELKGWMSQEELMRAYERAAVLAAPSVVARDGDMDGLPNVVVEAAALGVPLVTTGVGGLPDLVRDGETGLVARPGDATDLAAKLEAALADPGAAQARARCAREAVEARHDEAKTSRQLMEALGIAL